MSWDFDTEGFADESPEAPARTQCSCGAFLPPYATMPQCRACMERFTARLKADTERMIEKEKAHGVAIRGLGQEIKRRRVA